MKFSALSLAQHNVLASLVKGRWIDGKAQTVALLRFYLRHIRLFYSPNFFAVKTEGLPYHHLSPRTNPPKTAPSLENRQRPCLLMNALPVSHPSETLGVQLRASMPLYERSVGFASVAIVVVCGRCVLHRLFATTCKHPCLKPLGVQLRASLPALEKGAARMKKLGKKSYLFYSVGVSYKTTATVFAVA